LNSATGGPAFEQSIHPRPGALLDVMGDYLSCAMDTIVGYICTLQEPGD